ncbi:MAG: histidine phosphatase family protein [Fimbriimonadaceae bacterium]|nr:histidine phosphatase family protein [Fimbriimonadaceae bacterium]
MNSSLTVHLVRHGQTPWNLLGRAQGHTDIELDDIGMQQAAQLAARFQGSRLDLVLTSDLQRAFRTAEVVGVAVEAPVVLDAALRERSFGEWEGQDYAVVRAKLADVAGLPDRWHEARPPGGESLTDVWTRLDQVVNRIQTLSGSLAVVSHGGTCGLLLAKLIGAPIQSGRAFRFGNTSVTELSRRPDGGWTLERYADTSHLETPSSPMIDATIRRV